MYSSSRHFKHVRNVDIFSTKGTRLGDFFRIFPDFSGFSPDSLGILITAVSEFTPCKLADGIWRLQREALSGDARSRIVLLSALQVVIKECRPNRRRGQVVRVVLQDHSGVRTMHMRDTYELCKMYRDLCFVTVSRLQTLIDIMTPVFLS